MKRVAARDEGSRHLWKALMRRYRPGRHCRLRKRFPLAGIIAWRHPRSRARVAILQRGGDRPIPGIHVFINFSHSSLNRSSIRIVYANHPSAWKRGGQPLGTVVPGIPITTGASARNENDKCNKKGRNASIGISFENKGNERGGAVCFRSLFLRGT